MVKWKNGKVAIVSRERRGFSTPSRLGVVHFFGLVKANGRGGRGGGGRGGGGRGGGQRWSKREEEEDSEELSEEGGKKKE